MLKVLAVDRIFSLNLQYCYLASFILVKKEMINYIKIGQKNKIGQYI